MQVCDDTPSATVTDAEIEVRVADWRNKLGFSDALEELADAGDPLMAALKTNDPTVVGRVVIAVVDALAQRLVLRDLFGPDHDSLVYANAAACMALAGIGVKTERAEVTE